VLTNYARERGREREFQTRKLKTKEGTEKWEIEGERELGGGLYIHASLIQ
jgi:hypothetical protein